MREKEQGYVMLYEMLLGKGYIQGGGKLKRHVMQYKARLEECLAQAKVSAGLSKDTSNESLLPKSARRHIFPRYVCRDQDTQDKAGLVGSSSTVSPTTFGCFFGVCCFC
ncbi:unnamed protein product [Ectocarpus sp. 13 AM-2016]